MDYILIPFNLVQYQFLVRGSKKSLKRLYLNILSQLQKRYSSLNRNYVIFMLFTLMYDCQLAADSCRKRSSVSQSHWASRYNPQSTLHPTPLPGTMYKPSNLVQVKFMRVNVEYQLKYQQSEQNNKIKNPNRKPKTETKLKCQFDLIGPSGHTRS